MIEAARPRPRQLLRPLALAVAIAAALGIGIGAGLHFLLVQRSGALRLPLLHGQAVWPAGKRPAPAFTLRDQSGLPVSLAGQRGRTVLLTFLDSRCRNTCPIQGRELAQIVRSLPAAARPVLLVVSVDPPGDTPASVLSATAKWHLRGEWHWLRGSPGELAQVWRDYGIVVIPKSHDIAHGNAVYLLDRRGFERTGYLFPFAPAFVARDLRTLAAEQA